MRALVIAGVWSAAALATSAAQKTLVSFGSLYRYHGDTIWIERDTSVTRIIYRGDTIIKTAWLNDVQRWSQTYVAEGDSGRLIAAVDQSGRSVPVGSPVRGIPLEILNLERRMLETQVRGQETMARISALGVTASLEPPVFSETVRTYVRSSALRLVQFRDTVKYIRGCPDATQADTTIYVLFKSDSVKRVKPERMFGQAMAVAVLGAMQFALNQERASARSSPPPADLPRAPGGCK